MSNWINSIETALTAVKNETGIPYDFQRFEAGAALPETYIVFFPVSNTIMLSADGVEIASEQKVQISLYFTKKSAFLEIPDLIKNKMISNGFTKGSEGNLPYDSKTGHYGYRIEFNYYER